MSEMIALEAPVENPIEAPIEQAPFARVNGEAITELPQDLYIPPDALAVFLEAFEGPLDLLLYLIRKQNIDILDIPVAAITEQYMGYIDLMQTLRFELAAEYLVMAAMLAEIKSRLLLPQSPLEDDDESDPRAELIRRLQVYEQFKQAAEDIDTLPRQGRDTFPTSAALPVLERKKPLPTVELPELIMAMAAVLKRADLKTSHKVEREPLSVRARMTQVLSKISRDTYTDFSNLFTFEEGRAGVVVSFIAILELVKQSMLELVQTQPLGPIRVRSAG